MRPMVSVSLMTYNHEHYIKQCIESILSQETKFNYEIVIGDDASTDRTAEIISEYAERYKFIRFIKRDVNIGLHENFMDIIKNCQGDYIALMEGDDFWLDNYKLQKQTELLESRPELSFCFGNAVTFHNNDFDNGKISYKNFNFTNPFSLHEYMQQGINIPNNTKMFRKKHFPIDMPEIFFEVIQWDWLLHVFMLLKGPAYYMDDKYLAYRRHSETIINVKNMERILKDGIYSVYNINKYLPAEYHRYFQHPLSELNKLSYVYLKQKEYIKFLKYFFKWLKFVPKSKIVFRDEFYKVRKNLML